MADVILVRKGRNGVGDMATSMLKDIKVSSPITNRSSYVFAGDGYLLSWNTSNTEIWLIGPNNTVTVVYKSASAIQNGGFTEVEEGCFIYNINVSASGYTLFYDKVKKTATRIGTHTGGVHSNFKKVSHGVYAFLVQTANTAGTGYVVDVINNIVIDSFTMSGFSESFLGSYNVFPDYAIVEDGIISVASVGSDSATATLHHRNINTKITTVLVSTGGYIYAFERLIDTENFVFVMPTKTQDITNGGVVYDKKLKTTSLFNPGRRCTLLYETSDKVVFHALPQYIQSFDKGTKQITTIKNDSALATRYVCVVVEDVAFMFGTDSNNGPYMYDFNTNTLTQMKHPSGYNLPYYAYGTMPSVSKFKDGLYTISLTRGTYNWDVIQYNSITKEFIAWIKLPNGNYVDYSTVIAGILWYQEFGENHYFVKTGRQYGSLSIVTRDLMTSYNFEEIMSKKHLDNFVFRNYEYVESLLVKGGGF